MGKSFDKWHPETKEYIHNSVQMFNAYFANAKHILEEAINCVSSCKVDTVHIMIGNEAADADSIISSLVYSYHKGTSKDSYSNVLYIPVLPIPREEFILRCDIVSLFQSLRIDDSCMFFFDEFPWGHDQFKSTIKQKLTLLDHNAMHTKLQKTLNDADHSIEVVEILDHHLDLHQHPSAKVREVAFENGIAQVGSCCTIIAEKILKKEAALNQRALEATLLLAVISLDTINFNPKAKKVMPRDISVAKLLETVSFASKENLFEWLNGEKYNIDHWNSFSIWNCLQCDNKELVQDSIKYGVSAILIDLEKFSSKASSIKNLIKKLKEYSSQNELTFLIIMANVLGTDGVPYRQILFYEDGEQKNIKRLIHAFTVEGTLELSALNLSLGQDPRIFAFHQKNATASRKQIIPLIQSAL
jgi:exopolyphosphatase